MKSNPLRGLFGVSSHRPEALRVAPQPIEPTENIYYEIPLGMVEKLQANPYAGDWTVHPDMHLIYVEEIIYIIFGLVKEKVSLNLGGGLSICCTHAPIMSSREK